MKRVPILISLFFLTLFLILPQSHSYTCTVANAPPIDLGNTSVVCIHIVYKNKNRNATTNATYDEIKTYAFKTTVDKFSALAITGIAGQISSYSSQVRAVIQSQNDNDATHLRQMVIANPSKNISRSIFSFVINIQAGLVTTIARDNAGCDNCDTSGTQTCTNTDNDQCFDKGKYGSNDPKFYISWVGTDVSGNHMLSHTKRLSRFTQYSIGSIYNKAKSLVT